MLFENIFSFEITLESIWFLNLKEGSVEYRLQTKRIFMICRAKRILIEKQKLRNVAIERELFF